MLGVGVVREYLVEGLVTKCWFDLVWLMLEEGAVGEVVWLVNVVWLGGCCVWEGWMGGVGGVGYSGKIGTVTHKETAEVVFEQFNKDHTDT